MRNQQDVPRFTLDFHRVAVPRLRDEARLLDTAKATLQRWRAQRPSNRYLDIWSELLDTGPDAIEAAVCVETDMAAELRHHSPLACALSPAERLALLSRYQKS